MSEEGFWIYKNGRRIFIRGKREVGGKYKSNKTKRKLLEKSRKDTLSRLEVIKKRLRFTERFGEEKENKKLQQLQDRLNTNWLGYFRMSHKRGK